MNYNREQALMKGLEIIPKDRWQNCRELYQALYAPAEEPEGQGKAKRAEEKGREQEGGEKKMAQKKAEAYSAGGSFPPFSRRFLRRNTATPATTAPARSSSHTQL